MLDAVDYRYADNASGIAFRLDGVVYEVFEDESDDYRSSMREILVSTRRMVNVFPSVQVFTRFSDDKDSDTLMIHDMHTAKCVIEVGTDNSDDCYPSFVASFSPENMVSNLQVKALWDAANAKLPYMRKIRNYTKQ